MSATVINLETIKAQRAAAAEAPEVQLARQLLDQAIRDQAAGKKRSEAEYQAMLHNFSIVNRRQRR